MSDGVGGGGGGGGGGCGALLEPGQDIRPHVGVEEARDLARRLYGIEAERVVELNAYDDKNFFLQEGTSVRAKSVWKHGYVLKILNSLDSRKPDVVDAQNMLMLHLGSKGVVCSQPIKNKDEKFYSLENIKNKRKPQQIREHIVRILTFQPGEILYKVPCTSTLMYEVGRYIARLHLQTRDFHHDAYKHHRTLWMLESVPHLKNFIFAVKHPEKNTLAMEIISKFERDVMPHIYTLERGILHGDFNEQNIIVQESPSEKGKWHVHGVIDFGDSHISCYIFDVAITSCYMILQSKDQEPLEAPGHVVAGYISRRNLTETEFTLLKMAITARLCQSLVIGAYSSIQDPTNRYVLTTAETGWPLLKRLSEAPDEELLQTWRQIIKSYTE